MYPNDAGFKEKTTSKDSAKQIDPFAKTLREHVLDIFKLRYPNGLTPDEAAHHLNQSILSVRPRISELTKQGLLEDSGQRRRNMSGHNAKVMRLKASVVGQFQRPLF